MGVQKKTRTLGPAFTQVTGTVQGGGDPSKGEAYNPAPLRKTHRFQAIQVDDRKVVHGLLTGTLAGQTASFRVASNDFSTGRAVIFLGLYEIVSHVDFQPGGNTTATAQNIAAAISNLPGFTATNNVNTVNITYLPPFGEVTFEVQHLGTVANFDQVTPSTGRMATGTPSIGGPALT